MVANKLASFYPRMYLVFSRIFFKKKAPYKIGGAESRDKLGDGYLI